MAFKKNHDVESYEPWVLEIIAAAKKGDPELCVQIAEDALGEEEFDEDEEPLEDEDEEDEEPLEDEEEE